MTCDLRLMVTVVFVWSKVILILILVSVDGAHPGDGGDPKLYIGVSCNKLLQIKFC